MKKKMLLAALLGTACLAVGCGQKKAETEKVDQAAVETEAETKTKSADETETESVQEDSTEAATEAPQETEAAQEAETEAETELGERPEYQALDYVTLGDYKELSVIIEPITVEESEIDLSIQGEIEAQDKFVKREDGTVKSGDIANIDYEGKKDGVAFDGGTAQGYDLAIGSGSFIDGFEDGLIDVAVGETVDLNLTFPENYGNTELAGQDVVFTVTVNYVREMPQITDELVSELSEGAYSTVDGYRAYMKELLLESKESEQEYMILMDLMTQLYNTCTINEYPQELLDYSTASTHKVYEDYASMYGMTVEDMVASYGLTMEDFEEMIVENVKENLQQELILKAIAEQEELLLSQEEYTQGTAEYAQQYGYGSAEEFEADYDRSIIEASLLMDKVMEFVKENALIEEVQETEAITEAAEETQADTELATEVETEAVTETVTEAENETAAETEA